MNIRKHLHSLRTAIQSKLSPSSVEMQHEPVSGKPAVRFGLPTALSLIIAAALLITLIAYGLYWNNTNRKYDIARPGSRSQSHALEIEDSDEADATLPVDADTVQKKLDFLHQELSAIDGLGKFSDTEMNNQNIRLAPVEQPSQ